MCRTLGTLVVVVVATVGCRNQTTTLTNPFLTPDRVPPPATAFPATGAPAPYLAAPPVAGAPVAPPISGAPPAATFPATTFPTSPPLAGPPATTFQPSTTFAPAPGTVPPATSYPGATGYPTYPSNTAPVTPPGGWGTYPPSSQTTPQSWPQQLTAREVTPAEYLAPVSGAITPTPGSATLSGTSDGFRPLGSSATKTSVTGPPDPGFRSPSAVATAAAGADSTAKFATGDNYGWLRGQLEYWPENGQWTMRYLSEQQADQYGGRVLIDNPQVLGNLPPGEFVMVRGQLFGRPLDDSHYTPTYRVASVQRQKQ